MEQPDITHYFDVAKKANCLVKRLNDEVIVDVSATPEFRFGILDLSTNECQEWYKRIIQDNMLRVKRKANGEIDKREWKDIETQFPAVSLACILEFKNAAP